MKKSGHPGWGVKIGVPNIETFILLKLHVLCLSFITTKFYTITKTTTLLLVQIGITAPFCKFSSKAPDPAAELLKHRVWNLFSLQTVTDRHTDTGPQLILS